jgi:hypothetical protein
MTLPDGSVSCPGCGHVSGETARLCRRCDTRLPAARKASRTLWRIIAVTFTLISVISLVLVFPQIVGSGKPEKRDAADFVTALSVVFVPLCFALASWANCLDPEVRSSEKCQDSGFRARKDGT